MLPDGLAFVTQKYEPQWVHSKILLERMDKEGLEPRLVAIVSQSCIDYLKRSHERLGDALGLTESSEPAPALPGLGDRVAELADAIANYGRILSGSIRHKQPETLARFRAAIEPFDVHRSKHRVASSGVSDDSEVEELEELDEDEVIDEDVDLDAPLPPLPEL